MDSNPPDHVKAGGMPLMSWTKEVVLKMRWDLEFVLRFLYLDSSGTIKEEL